jgi:hypothetical protein
MDPPWTRRFRDPTRFRHVSNTHLARILHGRGWPSRFHRDGLLEEP